MSYTQLNDKMVGVGSIPPRELFNQGFDHVIVFTVRDTCCTSEVCFNAIDSEGPFNASYMVHPNLSEGD